MEETKVVKEKKTITFQRLPHVSPSVTFNGFIDANGEKRILVDRYARKRADGTPAQRRINFENDNITIASDRTEEIKFFRESPYCLGSELQKSTNTAPWYQELDPIGSASVIVEKQQARYDAMSRVLSIKNESELAEFAITLGITEEEQPIILKQRILDVAQAKPTFIIEKYDEYFDKSNGLQKYMVVAQKALKANIIKKRDGLNLYYNELFLGNTIEKAAKKLMTQIETYQKIEQAVA